MDLLAPSLVVPRCRELQERCSDNFVTLAVLRIRLRSSAVLIKSLHAYRSYHDQTGRVPYLEKADIDACLEYAARHAAHREILLSK